MNEELQQLLKSPPCRKVFEYMDSVVQAAENRLLSATEKEPVERIRYMAGSVNGAKVMRDALRQFRDNGEVT